MSTHEFTQTHRGITWHIKTKSSDDGSRVDVYIGPKSGNYPHIHVFSPDRHGTDKWAVLAWEKRGEHTDFSDMPAPLQQYVLDLLANLKP